MKNRQINQTGYQGLAIRIKNVLNALLDCSTRLRLAIIKKDSDTIWKILAEQQERLNEFEEYNYLWTQMNNAGIENHSSPELKEEINTEIKKLREKNKTNSHMIMSFLSAIRKALTHTGTNIAKKTKVYGKSGKMKLNQMSLKINYMG